MSCANYIVLITFHIPNVYTSKSTVELFSLDCRAKISAKLIGKRKRIVFTKKNNIF